MNTKVILLDADVFIHFMKAERQELLPEIFPNYQLKVLDVVYEELSRRKVTKECVDVLLATENLKILEFPSSNANIVVEYARLQSDGKGLGESACMAVARYRKNIIASSNLRDIRKYCQKYKIIYLTTMDFLAEAFKNGILSEYECDEFIRITKSKGSKLPVKHIIEYDYKLSI